MIEEAFVADVEDGRVWLEKNRISACSSCAEACPSALASEMFGKQTMRLRVSTGLPLRKGDKVQVLIPDDYLAKSTLAIYLFPLVAFFAGGVAGIALFGMKKRAWNACRSARDSVAIVCGVPFSGMPYGWKP